MPDGKQSFPTCVPKQSLGTRMVLLAFLESTPPQTRWGLTPPARPVQFRRFPEITPPRHVPVCASYPPYPAATCPRRRNADLRSTTVLARRNPPGVPATAPGGYRCRSRPRLTTSSRVSDSPKKRSTKASEPSTAPSTPRGLGSRNKASSRRSFNKSRCKA